MKVASPGIAVLALALGVAVAVRAQAPGQTPAQGPAPVPPHGQAPGQTPSACDLYFENTPATRMTSVRESANQYNSFIGGGVIAHCRGQNNTITSDSAEFYDALNMLYMIDHVHYREPRISVDADHMTYYVSEGRLVAEGSVYAIVPNGSTMRGPWAEYLRVLPGIRTESRLTAVQRPHLHLIQQDSAQQDSARVAHGPALPFPRADTTSTDTAGIDADQIVMQGDSLVYASHHVITVRTDARTVSDSAMFDNAREFSRLLQQPMITGTQGAHPFTLRGKVIDLFSANHELQRVFAMAEGDAVSQDLHLVADTIDLRLIDKQLARAYAWSAPGGKERAHATTPVRDMLADSIDVRMPAQVVHQMNAVRRAYGTSMPDSTKIRSTERDWIKGDTIFAWFDTTQARPAAGNSEPAVTRMLSSGDARSYYQMPPKDTSLRRPALNYSRGRTITIDFVDREVHTVAVQDRAAGVYLEPVADTLASDSLRLAKRAAADSVRAAKRRARRAGKKAPRDTTATPRDTIAAPHDTSSTPRDTTVTLRDTAVMLRDTTATRRDTTRRAP
jgi:hypothetical protein